MNKKSDTREAARHLGSILGKANIKKHGKGRMKKIVKDYWNSPEGQRRRKNTNGSKLSTKSKKRMAEDTNKPEGEGDAKPEGEQQ